MKRILLLPFLLMIFKISLSQGFAERITAVLNQVGKEIPSDQLFLHLDRNLYLAGDTIRFQAYIRDSRTCDFTTESSAMYALLLNTENATVDSARFRIMYSSVSGWLRVPDNALPGVYSVLAFTSLDMNYSPKYAFSAPVKIGNYNSSMTSGRSTVPEVPYASSDIPVQLPQLELRFLPEGGTFISEIKQRLAFNAVRANGTELEVSGKILNQRDEKITSFKSTPYGPGVIEFTPAAGDTYFAVIDGEEFREVRWSLPFAEKSGVSMQVLNDGNDWDDIILRGRGISDKSWFLTITLNDVMVFSDIVRLDTLFRKRILTDKLPAGTAYVTLYDSELNPVAERLIFINDYKKINISAEIPGESVFRGEETELTIHTTDCNGNGISSVVSVAVIDSVSGFCDAIAMPEIESAWLYDREFYNNLPFSIKSNGMESIDNMSVDVLLMTYGWRSFHPKEITIDDKEKELADYDFVKIVNPGPVKKTRSDINLISDANVDLITLPLNKDREADLYYDSLDINAREIMILPDKNPVKNTSEVNVLFPENRDYTDIAKQQISFKTFINPLQPDTSINHAYYVQGSVVVIEPVTIKAPKQAPEKYEDKYAKMFQYAGSRTMTSTDYREASSFEDIVFKYNPYYYNEHSWWVGDKEVADMGGKEIYLRANEHTTASSDQDGNISYSNKMIPALIVVDNNPIGLSYETIASMPASEIVSVTFMKGPQGFAMYGNKARGGVVFVTTKMGAKIDGSYIGDDVTRSDDLLKEVRLFRTETEYYVPTKEEAAQVPEFQNRPTLLWRSDVQIGESGKIKLTYPNNASKGTEMVFLNGISYGKRVGSGRYSYKVE